MKRLAIILPVLLIVVGGAVAGVLFMRAQPGAEPAGQPAPDPPTFVELRPLVLPMIQEGQVTKHLTLKVVVEVNADYAKPVEYALPVIRDAYFTELHGLLAMRYVREHSNMLGLLGERLVLVSDRLLGEGVVGSVLVSELSRRNPTKG